MTKSKRKLTNHCKLTERRKDRILEYIRVKEITISDASLKFGLTQSTINKIYTERFGKRDKEYIEQ
tara:strand:+ start:336 stop:533 length:198 start_codon:yes stop_codon:yes gene_type:complete